MPAKRSAKNRHRKKPDPLGKRVGAAIQQLRKERNFTFDAFAEDIGRGYTSQVQRGLLVPSLRKLSKIAAVLEVSIADLVLDESPRAQLYAATRELSDEDVLRLLAQVRRAPKKKSEADGD